MKLYIIGILAKILGIVIPPLLGVALLVSAECKVTASMQRRKGLNVVGLFGSLQPLADGLKLMIKELILPSSANLFISIMAPVITFMSSSVAWAVIPFDYGMVLSDSNVGILHLFAISSLGVYGIITVGRVSNPKYASSGASRSAAQTVLYEVSIGPIIITVSIRVGPRNLSEIVMAQKQIWFGIPLFPVLIMFFISRLAETNRAFSDPPEAEAESVAGYNVEYPLMGFAPPSLGEYANMILMSSLCTLPSLGGWPPIPDFPIFEAISGSIWFSIKVLFFPPIHIRVRAAFPRYRYDQSMRLGWKVFLPLSLARVVFVSGIPVAFDWLP
uniref:NADH-ubiquinone oxidoreductase chain 1 n=1 Tax=Nothoceros aenigmaticus TaxID=13813 RepID=C3RYN6_9EMBR|nr:NADH dehydrogenase subunit 1 [Nothoceros aenigmaticus]ACC86792.1 NADH dehydrogenase subunit 1 [Nothoceros aenigmaticus]